MGGRTNPSSGSHSGVMRSGGSGAGQRHRYVRDGEVPVVHATLGRQATRPDASMQQDKALLESLRQDLERERAAREVAERSLHETRATLVTLQTRLAHVEMDLQEAQEQVVVVEAATAPAIAPVEPVRRRPRIQKPDHEPQPVKWWIKVEKA